MTKTDQKAKKVDIAYPEYTGKKIFLVQHPDYPDGCRALAPDEDSALLSAAEHWNRRWQEYAFYAYCNIKEVWE